MIRNHDPDRFRWGPDGLNDAEREEQQVSGQPYLLTDGSQPGMDFSFAQSFGQQVPVAVYPQPVAEVVERQAYVLEVGYGIVVEYHSHRFAVIHNGTFHLLQCTHVNGDGQKCGMSLLLGHHGAGWGSYAYKKGPDRTVPAELEKFDASEASD